MTGALYHNWRLMFTQVRNFIVNQVCVRLKIKSVLLKVYFYHSNLAVE